jgi:hypothetical protein
MKKILILSVIAVGILVTACYKVHRTYIIKGKWYLNAFEIDGGSTNHMEGFLDDYSDGDGTYVIYMLDNGIARGEYYVYDTLNYFSTGTWNLSSMDSITMNMDEFVDGTFKIELINNKKMLLNTPHNDIKFFEIGDVKTVLKVSREGKAEWE